MKKFITTFAAVVIAASVTASAAAATAFHSNYSGTQDIKKGTETVYSIDASYQPEVATGNAKVATTKYWYSSGNRHFYKLHATGNVGSSTGVYAGTKTSKSQIFVAKVAASTKAATPVSSVKCSLSGNIDLTTFAAYSGGALYFTVDAPSGVTVSVGDTTVGAIDHRIGVGANQYAYFPAADKPGASTGVYANGQLLFTVKNYHFDVYNKSQDEFADELLTLINNERVSRGTTSTAVKVDYLMKAAAIRAQEMSISLSHVRPSGTTLDLVNSFSDHKVYAVAEIGHGPEGTSGSATSSFSAWMHSAPHKTIMDTPEYVNYGAAYYTTPEGTRYFVALFSMN
ncbi:CAP domain-containing protein [Faecalispora jeddahensis]|uniref:CAP domain-containing protein n=1 Tax=Faecalispora jeddahensis TaxID=1414721 RepID=UPI00145B235C|nr:CAP domain-containing protein [Faecalispora jeddahensis]